MPRSRGFRVSTDGNVSVYPASPRARLPPLKSVKVIPSRPSVNRARSRQGRGQADAANARTRRSAARAAKNAERREQAELRLQQLEQQLACKMAKVQRWRRAQDVWTAYMRDRTASAPAPSSPQPAALAPAPAAPPPPAPSSPDVCMRSLCSNQQRSACTTRRTPGPPKRLPPSRARPRRKGASQGPSPRPSPPPPHRRPTPPPPKPPPTDAQPHRAALYPTAPSTHLAAVRLLARLTHAYQPWAGNKHPCLGTRVPATPQG